MRPGRRGARARRGAREAADESWGVFDGPRGAAREPPRAAAGARAGRGDAGVWVVRCSPTPAQRVTSWSQRAVGVRMSNASAAHRARQGAVGRRVHGRAAAAPPRAQVGSRRRASRASGTSTAGRVLLLVDRAGCVHVQIQMHICVYTTDRFYTESVPLSSSSPAPPPRGASAVSRARPSMRADRSDCAPPTTPPPRPSSAARREATARRPTSSSG